MKKVFIKYNPYKLETEITVDGKKLAQNSKLGERSLPGSRLQEWVEDLPQILIDEYNDNDFDIVFHGTLLDFEDLEESFRQAFKRGELTAKLNRKDAKETSDKKELIEEVFKDIQNGPFEELKDAEIVNAFHHAMSSDFEVCVVATMSAGKSTLINALLRTKLMPSKQEACTAIITKIKDTKGNNSWQAEIYNKDNQLIETNRNLTYSSMERLNNNENVSVIKIAGNIPFVSSKDVSLVLIDTPGPNNSRDPRHKKIQSEFLNKSSKSLVLYIMEGTFGSDDDKALLQRVANSMKVGGKQSKDRFIFVVNKMDARKKEDGDTAQYLDKIRGYLNQCGIKNPNLFPATALQALNIRLIQSGADVDDDTKDETECKVRKLNRNGYFHFEKYPSLPSSIDDDIRTKLEEATNKNDANTQALIHTGIVSIEAAISQYVNKYAKTAKIKNIVDTFIHKLDEVGCFENTKKELATNRENGERIARQIKEIKQKLNDDQSAQQFKEAVDAAINKAREDTIDSINEIVSTYQAKIRKKIDERDGQKLSKGEAICVVSDLERYARKFEPDFEAELDELIHENFEKTSNALLQEYKKKLESLTSEVYPNALKGISLDPLKLMMGTIPTISVTKLVQSKTVEDGKEWVENTNKKWYKPWTWIEDSGYYRTKYKEVEYIYANDLVYKFFGPINNNILANRNSAYNYVNEQSKQIVDSFNKKINILNSVLKKKLSELENYRTDKTQADERIKEAETRLKWLDDIMNRVSSILEI